jgi:hypothetical protein
MHRGFVSDNKNEGVQLGLTFVLRGKTISIVKTLVIFETLQYPKKVIQLGSKPVTYYLQCNKHVMELAAIGTTMPPGRYGVTHVT